MSSNLPSFVCFSSSYESPVFTVSTLSKIFAGLGLPSEEPPLSDDDEDEDELEPPFFCLFFFPFFFFPSFSDMCMLSFFEERPSMFAAFLHILPTLQLLFLQQQLQLLL